jgi:mRNA interferase RelE/StbE
MYTLIYSSSALKQLEKLDKNMQERILLTLERLRLRPESCSIKKLVGMSGYRLRVGDYRVIFDMENDKLLILVLQIGHRKHIYDNLK